MAKVPFSKGAIGRGAIWSILNQSTGQILGLLVFLTTARFVSKEAFGIMAVCLLVVETFRQFWSDSIVTSVAATRDPTDQDYNAAFLTIALGGLVSAVLVFALAGPIAAILNHAEIKSTLRWVSLLLLTIGMSRAHEAWLTKKLAFKALALRSLISIALGGGIGVYMAVHGYGLLSLIAQQLITSVVGMLCLWMATEWRPSLDTHWSNVSALLRHSRYLSLTAIASMINTQSDVFFSSFYLGAAQTGVYAAAKRILIAITIMFSSGLGIVMLPALSAVSDDQQRTARSFIKTVSLTSFMSAALFAGLAAMSPELIRIVLGEKWADVAPIVSILAINGYLSSILQYSVNVMLVKNKAQWNLGITIVNAVSNVALFIGVGSMGLVPLAVAYALKNLVLFPLTVVPSLRLLNIPFVRYVAAIAPSVVAACVVGVAVGFASHRLPDFSAIVRLLILVPAGAVCYLLMMAVIDRKTMTELYSVARHLRKD
jgi:O-antigen/teichoic acid export membrane protein